MVKVRLRRMGIVLTQESLISKGFSRLSVAYRILRIDRLGLSKLECFIGAGFELSRILV